MPALTKTVAPPVPGFRRVRRFAMVATMANDRDEVELRKQHLAYLDTLLIAAKNGDSTALGTLLRELLEDVRRRATGKLGTRVRVREDTSDLVQKTLLQSIEDFHQFQGKSFLELRGYLREILKNNTIDTLRAQLGAFCRSVSAERSLDDPDDGPKLQAMLVDPDTSPSGRAARNELYAKLQPHIDKLPTDQRKALGLWKLGFSYQEIADDLGKTVSAAQSLVKHALQTLRERMISLGEVV